MAITGRQMAELERLHERSNPFPNIVHHGYTRVDVDPDDAAFHKAAYEVIPSLVARVRELEGAIQLFLLKENSIAAYRSSITDERRWLDATESLSAALASSADGGKENKQNLS